MASFFDRLFRRRDESSFDFQITDGAKRVLLSALNGSSNTSRVCIAIFIDDPRFEVNFHYDVQVIDNPSKGVYEFFNVDGVPLAVRPADVRRLRGAKLDFYKSGKIGGFIFNNPNAPDDVLKRTTDS